MSVASYMSVIVWKSSYQSEDEGEQTASYVQKLKASGYHGTTDAFV